METKKLIIPSSRFSFGSSSAIITNIALTIGLDTTVNAKSAIIGSLLVVALADNISDTLGMHMFQESEGHSKKTVWLYLNYFYISTQCGRYLGSYIRSFHPHFYQLSYYNGCYCVK